MLRRTNKRVSAHKGQGVIEYSGALVIAATVVAAGIFIVPPAFASLFETITESVNTYFTSFLS